MSKKNPEIKVSGTDGEVKVPLNLVVPEDMQTAYVSDMAVQESNGMFMLSFFDVKLPLTGPPAEEMASLESLCVARIAISAQRMPAFIGAMISNHQKYLASLNDTPNDPAEAKAEDKEEEE